MKRVVASVMRVETDEDASGTKLASVTILSLEAPMDALGSWDGPASCGLEVDCVSPEGSSGGAGAPTVSFAALTRR